MKMKVTFSVVIVCLSLLLSSCKQMPSQGRLSSPESASSQVAVPDDVKKAIPAIVFKQCTSEEVSYFRVRDCSIQYHTLLGKSILFAYFKKNEKTALCFGIYNINAKSFTELSIGCCIQKVIAIWESQNYYYIEYASNTKHTNLVRLDKDFSEPYFFDLPDAANIDVSYDDRYLLYTLSRDGTDSVYLYTPTLKSSADIYDYRETTNGGVTKYLLSAKFIGADDEIALKSGNDGGGSEEMSVIDLSGRVIEGDIAFFKNLPVDLINIDSTDPLYCVWKTDSCLNEIGSYRSRQNLQTTIIKSNGSNEFYLIGSNQSGFLYAELDDKTNVEQLKYYYFGSKAVKTVFNNIGNSDDFYNGNFSEFYLSQSSGAIYYLVDGTSDSDGAPYLFKKILQLP